MSYKKSDYFDFCEWALTDNPDLSEIDLSRSFIQRDSLYMKYLVSIVEEESQAKRGGYE